MGQYYRAVAIGEDNRPKNFARSYDFDNGAKLMEHSYIHNNFVNSFELSLLRTGVNYKSKIVWAGDYADEIHGENNDYDLCDEKIKLNDGIDFSKDPSEEFKDYLKRVEEHINDYPFLINHTNKEFVDKRKIWAKHNQDGDWAIHPLPLLTADGNGQGGAIS